MTCNEKKPLRCFGILSELFKVWEEIFKEFDAQLKFFYVFITRNLKMSLTYSTDQKTLEKKTKRVLSNI